MAISSNTYTHHTHVAKTVLALFIVWVFFGIFLLFNRYQDNIMASSTTFRIFMTLAVIASVLLISLLFLANKKQAVNPAMAKSSRKSSKTKKTKKK